MENKAQINLRDMLQLCRSTLNDLNSNTLIGILRDQNTNFNKALDIIEKYLPVVENAIDQDKSELSIKAATIFLIGLWARLKQGGSIADLTNDDWNSALGAAVEKAVTMDPQEYSLKVFDLYKKSIAFVIDPMKGSASESVISRLEEIVALMEGYAGELEAGNMPEVKFIEENLWLSLEAIFLVMTDRMSHVLLPEKRRELAEAVSALVFQKFRYSHYEQELAAINACLDYQTKLDKKLENQINAYIDSLRDELDMFDALVEKAFNTTDFQAAFRGSIDLAKSLGADGILQTQQEVDDYFMA